MAETWRLAPQTKLVWHDWESEVLVYNESSGATHLLDPAAAKLLQVLEKTPQTISQLSQQLGEVFAEASQEETVEWSKETLKQFKRLGLACIINR